MFSADLIFPLGKVTVVLFHNAFHFSESTHKHLHIGITVLFECIGKLLFQLQQNFVLQVFNFPCLILYFYHQVSHMAKLCHINIKRRLATILRNRLGGQPLLLIDWLVALSASISAALGLFLPIDKVGVNLFYLPKRKFAVKLLEGITFLEVAPMIFAEQVKNQLLSLIREMASVHWLFSKNPEADFSRNRKLDFTSTVQIILSSESGSLKKELLEYFHFSVDTPSASAFSQQIIKGLTSFI